MKEKIKLALVVDVENWAYANIARHFKKELINDFDITILPMSKIEGNAALMWLLLKDIDIIHFFCRGLSISYIEEYMKNQISELGGDIKEFIKDYINGKLITTCVYDHLFLKENDIDYTKKIFNLVENYYVSSNKLKEIYTKLDIKNKPKCVITDGIDFTQFYPLNIDRFDRIESRTIKFGWVGNSKWVGNNEDYKGIHTIIKPAIEQLREEGFNIELQTSDKNDKHIPIEEMINYYSDIDVYLCLSKAEGTPNPVLEAMACGIPIISTNVGIVSDALGPKQQQMILEDRTVECLKEKIKYIINNKELFKTYSKENLEHIKQWEWKYKAEEFKNFILESYKK